MYIVYTTKRDAWMRSCIMCLSSTSKSDAVQRGWIVCIRHTWVREARTNEVEKGQLP